MMVMMAMQTIRVMVAYNRDGNDGNDSNIASVLLMEPVLVILGWPAHAAITVLSCSGVAYYRLFLRTWALVCSGCRRLFFQWGLA